MSTAHILIVDDEPHVTYLLATKLKKAGYSTRIANDGEEALDLIAEFVPDLILTDYQMPYLDGFSFACQLRERAETRDTPVIMLTARGHKIPPEDMARTNIRHLQPKPFSGNDVLELIRETLGESPQREAA